jgi:hypothetical protein
MPVMQLERITEGHAREHTRGTPLRIPVIVLPGVFSPRPPFSRFARRAVPGWAGESCYRKAEGRIPSEYQSSCFLGKPPDHPGSVRSNWSGGGGRGLRQQIPIDGPRRQHRYSTEM